MGTSTPWQGPKGGPWKPAAQQLARWRPEQRRADLRLQAIAEGYLRALHETTRADRSAFGLYDAACAAGERLTGTLGTLAAEGADSEDGLVIRLTSEVPGHGGTIADAAVRRATVAAVRDVLDQHPEVRTKLAGQEPSGGFAWDLLCDLYQVFFADVVKEFLRSVVAEHISLAVPVLHAVDAEHRIADWIAEKVVDLVPDPCEESAEATELTAAVGTAESVVGALRNPVSALPEVARSLVPGAVGRVLGLITEEAVSGAEATT